MRSIFLSIAAAVFLTTCTNKEGTNIPKEPVSVEAVRAEIKNKNFVVADVGFISTFMGKQEPLIWADDMKDTGEVFRKFVEDLNKFNLRFVNDTTVKLIDAKQNTDAFYDLEKDTSKAVLLFIKFADKDFSFPGADEPMMVTYTYKIQGIEGKRLLLETPRSYNRSKAVLMMKEKD